MSKPCKGCNEKEWNVYREGKVALKFIRANKKPAGAMQNYKDGETYWMHPRHASYPWWEPIADIKGPLVKPATEKESAFEPTGATASFQREITEDSQQVTITEEGYTLSAPLEMPDDEPKFESPDEFMDRPVEILMPDVPEQLKKPASAPAPKPKPKEEPKPLGFPEGKSPSQRWRKEQLLAFILHKGGGASTKMRKKDLLAAALSLA